MVQNALLINSLMWWEDFDGKIPIFTILKPMEMTVEI
jgi:hypothetical protein